MYYASLQTLPSLSIPGRRTTRAYLARAFADVPPPDTVGRLDAGINIVCLASTVLNTVSKTLVVASTSPVGLAAPARRPVLSSERAPRPLWLPVPLEPLRRRPSGQ
ncbi:hypothetical protein ETB97_003480 [Aspergillus alliaceus]|uniref:Uncharacterized protein n=1 Tax=Petromyces alliaceus TaxID=209559 RepID=A0A8H6E4E2_PETAA|nr:hypothetical protein ETB97_003480 [Aspergillus burnettii]